MPRKISSSRRIKASRANGARSRGPVTREGKLRSAQNALKHGLTAQGVVLSGEDAAAYNQLRATYFTEFQPRTQYESDLVDSLLNSLWHTRRATCLESAAFDVRTENQRARVDAKYDNCSPDVRAAIAFSGDMRRGRGILNLGRFVIYFDRQYHRALKLLLDVLNNPPLPGPGAKEGVDYLEVQARQELTVLPQNRENEPNPISGHRIERFTRVPKILTACSDPCSSASICGQ